MLEQALGMALSLSHFCSCNYFPPKKKKPPSVVHRVGLWSVIGSLSGVNRCLFSSPQRECRHMIGRLRCLGSESGKGEQSAQTFKEQLYASELY